MLTTQRLHLRPWQKTDLPAMHAISADADVMRHFPRPNTLEETEAFISRQQRHQRERGYCFFAAELRETNEVIGFIGLSYLCDALSECRTAGWRRSR